MPDKINLILICQHPKKIGKKITFFMLGTTENLTQVFYEKCCRINDMKL
jgi:hypothetical protein